MTRHVRALCILAVFGLAACDEQTPVEGLPESIDAQLRSQFNQWGVVPIGDIGRQDPALVALGQALVFDKILSGNRDIACATCHDPVQHAGMAWPWQWEPAVPAPVLHARSA